MLLVQIALMAVTVSAQINRHRHGCTQSLVAVDDWPTEQVRGVCVDDSYYDSSDQGSVTADSSSSTDLQQTCQTLCQQDSNCQAVVAETTFRRHSSSASGVCYLYDFTDPSPDDCGDNKKRLLNADYKTTSCATTTTTTTPSKKSTVATTTTTPKAASSTTSAKPTTTTTAAAQTTTIAATPSTIAQLATTSKSSTTASTSKSSTTTSPPKLSTAASTAKVATTISTSKSSTSASSSHATTTTAGHTTTVATTSAKTTTSSPTAKASSTASTSKATAMTTTAAAATKLASTTTTTKHTPTTTTTTHTSAAVTTTATTGIDSDDSSSGSSCADIGDEQTYIAADGKKWHPQCNVILMGSNTILATKEDAAEFSDCLDFCSTVDGAVSAQYYWTSDNSEECTCSWTGGEPQTGFDGFDSAWLDQN